MCERIISSSRGVVCLFIAILSLISLTLLAACARVTEVTKSEVQASSVKISPIAVTKAARQDLIQSLVLSAEFRPYQEVDVHAKVSGYIKDIYIDVGDRVKAGQLLAELEIPEFKDDLEQAEAANRRFEEEIIRAQSELKRAEATHEEAHISSIRLESVIKARPNLIAQQEIDQAVGRDRVAEAQVSTAKAALEVAKQQLEVSKANEGKVKTLSTYLSITAPFTGVITKRFANKGALIQAGTASNTQAMPLVCISENSRLRLILPVPESVVPNIHIGMPVDIKVQSLEKSFKGQVSRFTSKVDMATRTMEAEVDIPNPGLLLTPGMYASAIITLAQKDNALTVPTETVNRSADKATVLIVNNEKNIEERVLTLGMETDTKVEVLSGLEDGDLIVIGNRGQYKPGQRVAPQIVEAKSAEGGQ